MEFVSAKKKLKHNSASQGTGQLDVIWESALV